MASYPKAAVQRARAMFKKRRLSLDTRGWKYDSFCPSARASPSRKGTDFVEHGDVARGFDEVDDGVGQPQTIVGDTRAYSASRGWMPPMLDVARQKLVSGGSQKMLARDFALGVVKRHYVLELVAKAVRAAHLIKPGAPPNPAGQRLIEQPAIEENIHASIGRRNVQTCRGCRPSGR
jgi:hypothetical protein